MLGMYLRVLRSRVMKPALLSECRSTEELDCGIDNALATLSKLDKEDHLFSRDIIAIDMRLSDRLTVQLSDDAAKAREEQFKKMSKKKPGDAA